MRLQERFITVKNEDEELKKKYFNQVIDLLKKSYAKIGGLVSLDSDEEILRPEYLWKLVKRGDTITAAILYRGNLQDRKMTLVGTIGTPEAKRDLYMILSEDIKQLDRNAWGEVSGALEHIYIDKLGGTPRDNAIADKVLAKLGKTVTKHIGDTKYTRRIGNTEYEKTLVGNVPSKYTDDDVDSSFLSNYKK